MKYEPVFRVAYPNIFAIELYIKAYAESKPLAIIKNSKWEFFLSKSALEKYSKIGFESALDDNNYKKLERNYHIFVEKFQNLKGMKIEELNKEEFSKFLKEFEDLFVNYYSIYKETEFFYFTEIEKELGEHIKDKFSFQDLLSGRVEIASWPEKMRKLADYIINIQHLKFEYRKILNDVDSTFMVTLLKQLVLKTGREDATSMTFKELNDCLNGKQIKDVSDRRVYSYITWDKEKQELNIMSGGDAYRKIRELDKYIPKKEVIGTPACKGIVKGEAKLVIITPDDLLKLKKGDILITSSICPDMVIAIEKAGAIVTNEGGLMSHAALLSREFDIPCVVGTSYATEVFKDGDIIEVNANNGIVRKME